MCVFFYPSDNGSYDSDSDASEDYYTLLIDDEDDVYGDLIALKSGRMNGGGGAGTKTPSRQLPQLPVNASLIIIIMIRNLYSAIMLLGGYRGAGGTGRQNS